ncbi:BBSome complex member BBS1-like [Saccoglossus kowalevskii]|uniref:Bardet-Biedl syndrome 1 protein-like n=1 Tax=Saccoglossus kowalevskii TaxID=10224 RepID=A0ABM0GL31_SACKO|nr:PREDICTED: Bardet-Biedl syndrome 1 protein-like [Saccoglossus kowalevskii]
MSVATDTKPGDTSSDEVDSKWLNAHYDPVASLYTFTTCMALSDLNGDGENKLIIADLGTGSYDMKLKVYKGTSLMSENAIIDLPTGVSTFFMDTNEPRTPAIAVASGPYIYVYKNLRPYFKFTLPPLEVNEVEEQLWNQTREDKIDVRVLREMLDSLRRENTDSSLTVRSLRFLMLDPDQMEAFADLHKHSPMKKQTVITCMDTLKKSMSDDDAISCLVIGTESKDIYILDPEAFTVLAKMTLPSVPVFLSVSGLYDVEFRIVVSGRNGHIYTLKRGSKTAKSCVELGSQPVGLQRVGKNIVVGCMDQTLQCFTTKGKRLWTVYLPSGITSMGLMDHKQRGFKAVLVGLNSCEVHVYRDKYLVNVIKSQDAVTGMQFGRFGREDGALVMTTKGGGLIVKILRRNAVFEERDSSGGPPVAQNQKLNVPKKTKLFVDQTMRERENGTTMHRTFQHDLYRMRLNTARAFVTALDNSLNPISMNPTEPLKLSAQIQGIGPTFKLTVSLQNTSMNTPSLSLIISFQYDDKLYALQKNLIHVPMLIPGLNYNFETLVECLNDKGISDTIKVFVLRQHRAVPIITAVINMPVSESVIVV